MPETEEVADIKDIFCFKSLYTRFDAPFFVFLFIFSPLIYLRLKAIYENHCYGKTIISIILIQTYRDSFVRCSSYPIEEEKVKQLS